MRGQYNRSLERGSESIRKHEYMRVWTGKKSIPAEYMCDKINPMGGCTLYKYGCQHCQMLSGS